MNPEELFQLSEELDKVWELEDLCRRKSLKGAKKKPNGVKLFLNVDPNLIHDKKFRSGMTARYLKRYNMKPNDIIYEITEHSSIEDEESFRNTVEHYQKQKYEVAVDDFGNGYAGLARVCAFSPDYIKIDMAVVKDIDKDQVKQSLVESCVLFCESEHIKLIAEGIESKEELNTLISMGIKYGQGYYFRKPERKMYDLTPDQKEEIQKTYYKKGKFEFQPSFFGEVGTIAHGGQIAFADQCAIEVYEQFEKYKNMTEVCIIDRERNVVGVLTRNHVQELFGGRFGFELHAKRKVEDVMSRDFLVVDVHTSIERVSKMALARTADTLYNAVIITIQGKYRGIVTVKDLLETAITIQRQKFEETGE